MKINRADFLQRSLIGTAGLFVPASPMAQIKQEKPPPLKIEIVKEYVTVAHGQMDRLKEMLENDKQLLHVSYDWGGGDYESAIEAAGHVGNKEIANWLILQGARTNLFVMTMLGKTIIVKGFIEAFPSYLTAKGPHGLTLLHHAQKGGENSKELLDYFMEKGLKETKMPLGG